MSGTESVQRYDEWQIQKAMIENDVQEWTKELLEEFNDSKETVKRNVEVMATSAAINQALINAQDGITSNAVVPVDERSTAVTALALDVYGEEGIVKMPGGEYPIGDIDMVVPRGENPSLQNTSLSEIWEEAYGTDPTDFRVSQNTDNLPHRKYSAETAMPSEKIECDIVRPDDDNELLYELSNTREVQISGDLTLRVPSISDMIRKKGTIKKDNGEGFDAFREKDKEEMLALLAMAEEEDIKPQYIKNRCDYDELLQISDRVEEVFPNTYGGGANDFEGPYLPSDDYAQEFMNWTS